MCGVVAFVGFPASGRLVIESLRRLEYRGYDSAGIALRNENEFIVVRAAGRLTALEEQVAHVDISNANTGIGHTRWATHGPAIDINAHPHIDCRGDLAVVHNGIVENHQNLRVELRFQGHVFRSETDTEVLAHLFEREVASTPWPNSTAEHHSYLAEIASRVISFVQGSQVVLLIARQSPVIVGFRTGHAGGLAVGKAADGLLLASDVPAIASHTSEFTFLDTNEIVTASPSRLEFFGKDGTPRKEVRESHRITFDPLQTDRGPYPTFMLKEIFEQPDSLRRGMTGRVLRTSFGISMEDMVSPLGVPTDLTARSFNRLVLTGCGTPWNACLVGRQYFEAIAGIPSQVEYAHEYAYRPILSEQGNLFVAVTQSGETADVLLAIEAAKYAGATTLALTNVVGSAASRLCDATWYLKSGPEFCVAETKTFTSQLLLLLLLALKLGLTRGKVSRESVSDLFDEIVRLPERITSMLHSTAEKCERMAALYAHYDSFLFLSRGLTYPIALEGALKLKELSYAHAEGYPAGEMKHGPIALITQGYPVVAIALKDSWHEKMISQIEQLKARGARILVVANAGDDRIESVADEILQVPELPSYLGPILGVIPLQLLAYYISSLRGNDTDHPRNLAKSVTVE